ncbi:MAG: prephenate dehydratase [Proteobacteria bacterium]|jgi:chorismate mutase / prephenate dehydratase|nr:prephenate dehydratase [Pseudomonadota bacterium]MCG6935480.1 prephenate dehydratase [Pseudomonadota bacterium]
MSDQLKTLRQEIDSLDEQIQALITKRAEAAEAVALTKQANGDTAFYRAEREAEVLRKVMARNQGPLSDEEMARLFREIMSACLALEQVMTIAFLGPEGTFTQAAALKHFGHAIETRSMATISDVFREVESEAASYGVVPIENSTEGVINHTLDEFMTSSLKICGEVALRIHHHLLGQGDDLTKIRKIYSHQQSLAQCRHWLDSHAPEIELVDVSSNAEAARRVAAEPAAAAIAGEAAAEIYGLNVISRNIEDEPDNTTRFLVIGRRETPASGTDKTSLLVYTDNRPGALYAILEPFARNGISMTRIESRPSRLGMWNYVFFIDIEGHVTDTDVVTALQELAQSASRVTVLGSYPRAVL